MKKYTFDFGKMGKFEKANLRDFASSWLAWAKAGGPVDSAIHFGRGNGLCGAAGSWDAHIGLPIVRGGLGVTEHCIFEIFRSQFERKEIESRHFPFNESAHTEVSLSTTDYYREANSRRCHLNKLRVEWLEALFVAVDESIKSKHGSNHDHNQTGSGTSSRAFQVCRW